MVGRKIRFEVVEIVGIGVIFGNGLIVGSSFVGK